MKYKCLIPPTPHRSRFLCPLVINIELCLVRIELISAGQGLEDGVQRLGLLYFSLVNGQLAPQVFLLSFQLLELAHHFLEFVGVDFHSGALGTAFGLVDLRLDAVCSVVHASFV
jgi:hypothetical protein